MHPLKKHKLLTTFAAVLILVLAQVIWWTTVFLRNVSEIEGLKQQNTQISQNILSTQISKEASQRRFMFISESISFVLLTCFGFYLLYIALRSEASLRKQQTDFLNLFTHESKTPLTALKLRLESILENDAILPEMRAEMILSLEEVRRLSSIIEKALDIHRIQRKALFFESVSLMETLEESKRQLEPLAKKNGVRVNLTVENDVSIKGDIFSIKTLVKNLIENAILYASNHPKEVRVALKQNRHQAFVIIEDNGPGIPKEEQTRLFEPFYRGTTKSKVSGSGLGLHIAKLIALAHGGQLQCKSEIHTGSCFTVSFPRGHLL